MIESSFAFDFVVLPFADIAGTIGEDLSSVAVAHLRALHDLAAVDGAIRQVQIVDLLPLHVIRIAIHIDVILNVSR